MRETDSELLRALRSFCRPLANVLLKNKIGITPVIEQLKLAFVEAARVNHGRSGKPASVNLISQLTGMSRQHVSQILSRIETAPTVGPMVSPDEAEVLGAWSTKNEYLDEVGLPKPLSIGPGPGSFRSLVDSVVGSEITEDVLDSLLSSSAIEVRSDGKIVMSDRIFRIDTNLPKIISVSLTSLCNTIDWNWGRDFDECLPLRVAHTSRLDPQKTAVVRRITRKRIEQFMEDIDDVLCSYEDDDPAPILKPDGDIPSRIGVGVYYFEIDK